MGKIWKNIWSYLENWWAVIIRPIYFFSKTPLNDWREAPFTFACWTIWIFSFFSTLVIFITKYISIGAYLIEEVSGYKLIFISPVLLMIGLVFFGITFGIVGAVLLLAGLIVLYCLGWVFDWLGRFYHRIKHAHEQMMSASFYSSAVLLFFLFPLLLVLLSFFGFFPADLVHAGFSLTTYAVLLYLYGLWSIAAKKALKISRAQAFWLTSLPAVVLLLLVGVVDWKLGEKIISFLL